MALRGKSWLLAAILLSCVEPAPESTGPVRVEARIPSSAGGEEQPAFVMLPAGFDPDGEPLPLVVSLHSWSFGYEQRREEFEAEAMRRGWIYLFPHFGGRNDNPRACGSAQARQDILDAVEWAKKEHPVDEKRIYLTGTSGGGHMTMLMAARHPEPWAAASAWVGISDLAAWHATHADANYGEMIRQCTGGAPGESEAVDREYRERSPLFFMEGAKDLPLDIAAGVHDGHDGAVPIRHSLAAFNALAKAAGGVQISEEEIEQLSRSDGRLENPRPSDQVEDPALGRKIYLRRAAGSSRVTIFEGGHEGIASAAFDWLGRHSK